jgi:hypothetical protein
VELGADHYSLQISQTLFKSKKVSEIFGKPMQMATYFALLERK